MDCIKIVRTEAEAKILRDPIRREILRLLAIKASTGAHLARSLGLSAPSVSHQLSALKKGGFVSVSGREEGHHGIMQNFYRPSAQLYVIDKRPLPLSIIRYFTPHHVERARGMVAALSLLQEGLKVPSHEIEKMAWDYSMCLIDAAEKHKGMMAYEDPEFLVNRLYRQALSEFVRSRPGVFPRVL